MTIDSAFLTEKFCRDFWVPLLTKGDFVEGDVPHERPPLWLQLLYIFQIKYLIILTIIAAVLAGLIVYTCNSGARNYRLGGDEEKYFFWEGTISALIDDITARCLASSFVGDNCAIFNTLVNRRYATVVKGNTSELKKVVSCKNFVFGEGDGRRDPLLALEMLVQKFPKCISIRQYFSGRIRMLELHAATDKDNMTRKGEKWLCDCEATDAEKFAQP